MKALTLAAVGLALALPSNAMAAQSGDAWYAQSVQTGLRAIDSTPAVESLVRPFFVPFAVRVRPHTGTPTFYANLVASGEDVAHVPCFGCVDDTAGTFGLPVSFNYVPSGSTWQYNVAWTNLSFSGTCAVSYAVASGTTVISKNSAKVKVSGEGGYDWAWASAPVTFSGAAVLTGKVVCDKEKSTVTAAMMFE